MDIVNRITKEPWFGKRRIGWGLTPISVQGWIVTLIFILIVLLDAIYVYKTTLFVIILIVAVICYLAVALLTSTYLRANTDE